MREIKFRAWIKDPKEMVYYDKLMLFNGSDEAIAFHNLETSYIDDYEVKTPFELMQYTGLLDCNGKEIYEGDVVRQLVESKTRGEEEKEWIREVPEFPALLFHQVGEGFFSAEDVEVIGNIYENPELLTK